MALIKLKVLDKYLVRNYLSTFFFCLLICTMISLAFDFSDKVQAFIEKPCTLKNIVFDYYLGFIFNITGLLMPIYTMIAVVFFTSRLASNSEILSIFNAGVSFPRLMRPYLLAGGLVALLHFSLNHFIIPKFNKSRLWFEHTFVWTDQKTVKSAAHFLVATDTKVFVKGYNEREIGNDKEKKTEQKMTGLRVEQFTGNRINSILEAPEAVWQENTKRWRLNSYSVHVFDGLRERIIQSNAPIDTAISLNPADFIFYQNQNQEMTTPELRAAISRDRDRGLASSTRSYEIEMHRRTADAFTNIILTIIGLAVAGRKVRGGMGLHLALGIGIGAIFILLSKFAASFASSGTVSPLLGMWMPNLIFMGVAGFLISRAQK